MMRSLSTSGDSLSPQLMFEPPNSASTFYGPEHLAGRGVEHGQVAARAERVDPIAVDRRCAARAVAAIVAEAAAVGDLPEPLPAGRVERDHVLGAARAPSV